MLASYPKKSFLNLVSATAPEAQPMLAELDENLRIFYNQQSSPAYFSLAHQQNEDWTDKKYHKAILNRVKPGMKVLELGCGSAHAFSNMQPFNPAYTGLGWSENQIQENQKKYGAEAKFVSGSIYKTPFSNNTFDLVFSLYVLEHMVWPHLFLEEAYRLTKPGGEIIILCPHFRPSGRIPSLKFGHSIAPLRDKIRTNQWLDAIKHFWNRNFRFPSHIRTHYAKHLAPFLINLEPTCLAGPYYADNDAVYFVDREEVVQKLTTLGATDKTEHTMPVASIAPEICFLVMRKDPAPSSSISS